MNWIIHKCRGMVCLLSVFCLYAMTACEGTESRDTVDRTVETITGKDHIQQMNQMKSDIEKINKKQAERLKQTE